MILESHSPQGENNASSPAKFAYWAEQSDVVQDVAAFNDGVMNWTSAELPLQLRTARVSSKYFSLFGVPFVMGRAFNAQEDAARASPAVVISEGLGAEARDVRQMVLKQGVTFAVVGVLVGLGADCLGSAGVWSNTGGADGDCGGGRLVACTASDAHRPATALRQS